MLYGNTKNNRNYLSVPFDYSKILFTIILVFQFFGGVVAYRHEVIYDFSNAKNATAYIKNQKLEKNVVFL